MGGSGIGGRRKRGGTRNAKYTVRGVGSLDSPIKSPSLPSPLRTGSCEPRKIGGRSAVGGRRGKCRLWEF